MNKVLINNKEELESFCSSLTLHDSCDAGNLLKYPPEKYPCLLVYHLQDIDSMSYGYYLWDEYVYLSDFEDVKND